ncbi:hypothetical protein BGZ47_000202, partial [Haplosporangium gracile]
MNGRSNYNNNNIKVEHVSRKPPAILTLEEEDNKHVWTCSLAAETTTTIWKEAMDRIEGWGVQATGRYNAAKK